MITRNNDNAIDAALHAAVMLCTLRPSFDVAALDAIAAMIRPKAAGLGITGRLLHYDKSVFEYLEGPPASVDIVIREVESDTRNHSVVHVNRGPVAGRLFSDWRLVHATEHNAWRALADWSKATSGVYPGLMRNFLVAANRWAG